MRDSTMQQHRQTLKIRMALAMADFYFLEYVGAKQAMSQLNDMGIFWYPSKLAWLRRVTVNIDSDETLDNAGPLIVK